MSDDLSLLSDILDSAEFEVKCRERGRANCSTDWIFGIIEAAAHPLDYYIYEGPDAAVAEALKARVTALRTRVSAT